MTEKLKPCPFCGGKAYIKEESDAFSGIYNVARCEKCGVEVIVYVDMTKTIKWNKQRVIERWNKRANSWHTGTPTEEGWYLCKSEHMVGYDVGYYVNGRFNRLHCFNQEDITEWQKIEP